ncbi:MAG: hypothetical protein CMP91_00940 [Gammaproteobacteria bacterium]|nr:hypothetical protein [Gammaproteobacteria bacterium]MAY03465.1 hypothetical protein [Gammaproteobacteria bacterium]
MGAIIFVLQKLQTQSTAALWLILLLTTSPACFADISLNSNTEISSEGYFVLNWVSDSDLPLVLQQSLSDNFSMVKETELTDAGSITITGLVDGLYYFRVINTSEQSNVVPVQVEHHSLGRALGFFFMGLFLFCVLVAIIFIGNKREPTL